MEDRKQAKKIYEKRREKLIRENKKKQEEMLRKDQETKERWSKEKLERQENEVKLAEDKSNQGNNGGKHDSQLQNQNSKTPPSWTTERRPSYTANPRWHLGGVQAEQAEQDDQPSQDQEMKLVSRADLHDDQTEQPCTSPIPKVALPYTSK